MVSSAYLRLLIFLLTALIPACASSTLAFHMMYFVYKLSKQSDSVQPWHTPSPIWNQSVVSHLVLTIASWSAYSFQFSMFYLAQTHEHIVSRLFNPDRKLSSINSIHFHNHIAYSPYKPFTFIFQILVSSPEFEFILFVTVCFLF